MGTFVKSSILVPFYIGKLRPREEKGHFQVTNGRTGTLFSASVSLPFKGHVRWKKCWLGLELFPCLSEKRSPVPPSASSGLREDF